MTLSATPEGLAVVSPTGRPITTIGWADVTLMTAERRPAGDDTGDGVLVVQTPRRSHRFVAPVIDVERFVARAAPHPADATAAHPAAGRGRHLARRATPPRHARTR
ncbi:MAG: hypothetical protein ABSG81_07005, partial [Acidimicrobiales bacterium]